MGTLNIFSVCVLSEYMEHAHSHIFPTHMPGVCKHIPSMRTPLWFLGRCARGSVAGVPVSLCDCLSMEGGLCRSTEWREVFSLHPDGPHRLSPLFLPQEGWSQCL